MKDVIPDIYKAMLLFIIVLAVWWFKPVPMIETMAASILGTVLAFLRMKSSSPTTIVEDSKTTVINAEQSEGSK